MGWLAPEGRCRAYRQEEHPQVGHHKPVQHRLVRRAVGAKYLSCLTPRTGPWLRSEDISGHATGPQLHSGLREADSHGND